MGWKTLNNFPYELKNSIHAVSLELLIRIQLFFKCPEVETAARKMKIDHLHSISVQTVTILNTKRTFNIVLTVPANK